MKIVPVASVFQYYSLQKAQTLCIVSTPSVCCSQPTLHVAQQLHKRLAAHAGIS